MKKRSLLLSVVAAFGFTTASMTQVPNYVPTNGLVGWWPFNGNANDESGNGNSGTIYGAALTNDRFGALNSAYSFDGVNDYIDLGDLSTVLDNLSQFSLSYWFNSSLAFNTFGSFNNGGVFSHWIYNGQPTTSIGFQTSINTQGVIETSTVGGTGAASSSSVQQNFDTHICITFNGNNSVSEKFKLFINGSFIENLNLGINGQLGNAGNKTIIGGYIGPGYPNYVYFNFLGILDDIGIWNRALTECEISDLYNAQLGSFSNTSVSVNPTSSAISSNATLTVSTPIQNVQWQSNPGNMGWNNVVNNNTYNGSTNDTLVVSNVQLSNHNQPFRLLACGDTSNVATIQIADTCVTTVYDTLLTTVTDTLIINTTLSLPAPNNENTILIYPNPASDHITIDNGNYSAMAGYSIKITNNAGQEVFLNAINQQQFYVDLSTWTGNGLYFVHLIDSQNNTVTVRKIVLQ